MKFVVRNKKYIIATVAPLGILTLLFFPEPETNFTSYLATALLFVAVIVAVVSATNKDR